MKGQDGSYKVIKHWITLLKPSFKKYRYLDFFKYNYSLQLGTSNVLMVFDESEVRKMILDCKKVLEYLAVSEVIESIEDLVQFVKDLSPYLSKVKDYIDCW